MEEVLVVIGLFLLRLGVPVLVTVVIAYLLHRLDARWETEAKARMVEAVQPGEKISAGLKALKPARPCWEQKGCKEEVRAKCPACKALDIPCWAAKLRATGQLPAACHNCAMFVVSVPAG
jgi:hypothetical protein